MEQMRQCRQCGEVKVIGSFRNYYGKGSKGHYTYCKQCEKINARYKYLNKKEALSEAEETELAKINQLYDILTERGLRPPTKKSDDQGIDLDAMILQQANKLASNHRADVPQELQEWLNRDITGLEDWELEEIFDELEDKYRPTVGMDYEHGRVVKDETYKEILDDIKNKFGIE